LPHLLKYRVWYQRVQPAPLGGDPPNQAGHLRLVTHVAHDRPPRDGHRRGVQVGRHHPEPVRRQPRGGPLADAPRRARHQGDAATLAQRPSAWTISSVIFFASPNSIIVFGRKNSSFSTPA